MKSGKLVDFFKRKKIFGVSGTLSEFNQLARFLKVYMTDFFLFVRLNLPNVLISIAKKNFDSEFPFPCFDVPKESNFTSDGVQNRETKKTGDWKRL